MARQRHDVPGTMLRISCSASIDAEGGSLRPKAVEPAAEKLKQLVTPFSDPKANAKMLSLAAGENSE